MKENKRKMKGHFIKNYNGITLIALVITIVVLLILAGVVLRSMRQSGILGKSQMAKEEYTNASTNETAQACLYENKEVAEIALEQGANLATYIPESNKLCEKSYGASWSTYIFFGDRI